MSQAQRLVSGSRMLPVLRGVRAMSFIHLRRFQSESHLSVTNNERNKRQPPGEMVGRSWWEAAVEDLMRLEPDAARRN